MSHSATAGSWSTAFDDADGDVTCLWQDLDGLHIEVPPDSPPCTSILWAWTKSTMLRVRLDGDRAYVARCPSATTGTEICPWTDKLDGRVSAHRQLFGEDALGVRLVAVVVDGIDDQVGPITFLRPQDASTTGARR